MIQRNHSRLTRPLTTLLGLLLLAGSQQTARSQVQLNAGDRYNLLHVGSGLSFLL